MIRIAVHRYANKEFLMLSLFQLISVTAQFTRTPSKNVDTVLVLSWTIICLLFNEIIFNTNKSEQSGKPIKTFKNY